MRWEAPETLRFSVDTPRLSSSSISARSTVGSMTTPLPMMATTLRLKMPEGMRWSANLPYSFSTV